ncbi:MAG: hypothetical protein JJT85_10620 [Chromatiales bacterium]|nr:hypothetical protein [Chromatiales bacterium]
MKQNIRASHPRRHGLPAALLLLAAAMTGCASLQPAQGDRATAAELRSEVAAANLAHTQLAALVYQDLLLSLAAGDLAGARDDLCSWLLESTVFLLDAVDELPPGFHPRTRGVLERLGDEPAGCAGIEALSPRIDAALERLPAG